MSSLEQFVTRCIGLMKGGHSSPFYDLERVLTPLTIEIEYLCSLSLAADGLRNDEGFHSLFLNKIRGNIWILRYQSRKLRLISHTAYMWYTCTFFGSVVFLSLILAPFHTSIGLPLPISFILSLVEATFIAPHIEHIVTLLFMGPLCDSLKRLTRTTLYTGPAWLIAEEQWKLSPHLRKMARKLSLSRDRP